MDVDVVARSLGVVSVLLAAGSLAWAMTTWRLSGPGLRVHAISYEEVLLIRVFNSGRQADTLEHLVVGGTRQLVGGRDLLHHMEGLPLRLEPGMSRELTISSSHPQLRPVLADLRGGWASLWGLTGTMRRLRVDVLPRPEARPGVEGWLLVARSTRYSRYLAMGAAVMASTCSVLPETTGRRVAVTMMVLVLLKRMIFGGHRPTFQRLRLHRRLVLVSPVVGFFVAGHLVEPDGTPSVTTWLLAAFLIGSSVATFPSGKAWVSNAVRDTRAVRIAFARPTRVGSAACEAEFPPTVRRGSLSSDAARPFSTTSDVEQSPPASSTPALD